MKQLLIFSVKKILITLVVLMGISLIAFVINYLSPGDAATLVLDQNGIFTPTEEQINIVRENLGLNAPWYKQYILWLSKVMHGDFGISYKTGNSVLSEIASRISITLTLALAASSLATFCGISFGLIGILKKNCFIGKLLGIMENTFLAAPSFLMSLLLILVVSEFLRVLPTSGAESIAGFVLPTFALSFTMIALVSRLLKEKLREEMNKQYFYVAIARGIPLKEVVLLYALPNAILPVLALLGNYFGGILGGSVVIESIFALPGLGSLALEAIRFRDYPVLQAYVLIMGCVFTGVFIIIDFLLLYFNPRIRIEQKKL